MTQPDPDPQPFPDPDDPEAIYARNGPFDPIVMDEALFTMMAAIQPDLSATQAATQRRMFAAMRALAALHPRTQIELMLGVQAVCAYHAANAAWHRATAARLPRDDIRRHVTTAASAARTFDTMLRGLERRQAKPIAIPPGRPPPRTWPPPDLDAISYRHEALPAPDPDLTDCTNDDELVAAWADKAREWEKDPNQGLDIANTQGILPDGSMIVPWNPTPQQEAYMERRLILLYVREQAEIRRKGSTAPIQIRPTRPGDLIP